MIQYVDFGTVEPYSIRLLDNDSWSDRFQTMAIENGKRAIGRWSFMVMQSRGKVWLDSCHTRVLVRLRRNGIAWELWRCGIRRWKPYKIEAMIASYKGCEFLGSVAVKMAIEFPAIHLEINGGDWRDTYNQIVAERALAELRRNAHAGAVKRRLESVP